MSTPRPDTCAEQYDPRESCGIYFMFADTLVKFIRPDSAVVYPTYPGYNDTLGKKNWIDLEVRVEYADSPIPNYWVRVDTPKIRNRGIHADSGGHSHSHTSPRRPVGRFIHLPITSTPDTTDTLLVRTDSTGVLKFRYLASQFGGVERIRARLLSDTTKWDTLSMVTKVPALILLPEEDTSYLKTGGTCNHHGPRIDTLYQNCRTPDNNHWIVPMAADSLTSGAHEFLNAPWNRNREKMLINDVSLPLGGLFDISGQWQPPHASHRTGKDVDIENIGRLTQLRRALENKGWSYIPEGPTFYPHFRFE